MCIACELSFWNMIDALPPEDQERILREQAARFACDAPARREPTPAAAAQTRMSANRERLEFAHAGASARRAEEEELLRRRIGRRASCRHGEGARAQCLCAGDAGARLRHGESVGCAHRRRQGRAAGRHSARHQGHVLHRRRALDGVLAHPRQFRADLQLHRDRQSVARRRGAARQDQQRRIRHGLVERDLAFRPGDLAVAAEGRQYAAGAGRLVAAVRRRRWRRNCAWARPAPTPAVRSGSRRPSPARSASSRPMAAARAGASWRLRPRSIRPARSRARCATPRSCCARWPGPMPRTPPAPICRCPTTKPRSASR